MSWSPSYILETTSGAGSVPLPVRKRILKFASADHLKFTSSTTTSKAALVATIAAVEPGLDQRQIELEFMAIGSGGAAASGEIAYGGLAGLVFVKKLWLSDVPEGSIYVDIGAGGLGTVADIGNGGSPTSITFTGGRSIEAAGGYGGWSTPDAHRVSWSFAVGYGARYCDPTITKDGVHNPFGPGNGGSRDPGYFGIGGSSSAADKEMILSTGYEIGTAGIDADPNLFEQFGSGGSAGDNSTPGGKGGIPGGAGGASYIDFAGGSAERGEARIRVGIWETV